ncbi:hypothetical protein PTTG_00885 [Puccinia triticina 1-1 BBBD Race 1]|uniref:Uncharacterized protein n=1 Tax=Puccinia triticina (isolate 1-1 / race 1 (BBBD)) TaxID=630390 RepID=A0A180GLC2_PUCT1|nr:hypothetical protein PTTG_00885 [Puccinia triticina 1-1 BBBD Race 1]
MSQHTPPPKKTTPRVYPIKSLVKLPSASTTTSPTTKPTPPTTATTITSPHSQPRSNGSNSSTVSSSARSRRTDCLPPIAEQSNSSNGSDDYIEKMGIGRARKSSTTRFLLPSASNSNSPTSIPMAPPNHSHTHSRQMSTQGTTHNPSASMLINLSGLTDFHPSAIASYNSSHSHSHDYHASPTTQTTGHALSDLSNLPPSPSSPTDHRSKSAGHHQHFSRSSVISHPSSTRGPPTIEQPVSIAGMSHAAPSAAAPSSRSDPSQCSSPPTILSDPDSYITTRFEYQQGEDGLLILTGRRGEFTACEDEPIRIPGAIQAFGVLIAVIVHGDANPALPPKFHYDPNDPANGLLPSTASASESYTNSNCNSNSNSNSNSSDNDREEIITISRLEVVQVSENSRHILGLSPKLLLNLYSFTEVLTRDQSQLLCDNLEVCLDSANTSTAGPHTFRMSGRGGIGTGIDGPMSHTEWSCWCAAHRPDPVGRPRLVIIEFELENDELNPPSTVSVEPVDEDDRGGVAGKPYEPTEQDLIESTMSISKPLRALARLRRKGKDFSGDSVEVLSILSQLNNQFDKADDMPTFLKMAVGLVRELTGFDRVMIYKFDESWNGQVVAELVDWKRTRDLYRGLRFPASDIPAQARELYKINKVRMLYDRDQPTARLMCKSQEELSKPLNMTHCHLRAMSPIHIKYLANMGVRSSFSISIIMNDELWGLISCHSYGRFGQRVTFPTRQFCTMLGDTVSRNILRLNLSQRLQSRKLINTTSTSKNPSGYIVAKAEDLLWLFDAQSGVLSIGEEAKILGTVSNSQEILAILEYLRVRKYDSIQVSTDINVTFPDIEYPGGFESISGVLVIPLSRSGQDFICFFRPAQSKEIHWAGNPHEKIMKDDKNGNILEPRKSFKIWSETVKERSKAWTDDQLETGSVLSLVYGKFIDVWRQKEAAVQNNQLQALLLSNASHEVRTPLHQILSTLELALDGQLDEDTRDNLSKSYTASRALVHVINDLLDLTKAEQGGDLFSKDPFELPSTIEEAVSIHQREAERKGLRFEMVEDPSGAPTILQGDRARLRQVVSNLVGNAVKHTTKGLIHVQWGNEAQTPVEPDPEDQALLLEDIVRISVAVTDTGKGIPEAQLENIFRAFEQVGSGESHDEAMCESIGLGLAVVGRVVHNMGGQLRVDSTVGQGSKFSITLPFVVPKNNNSRGATSDDSSNVKSIGSGSLLSKHTTKMSSSRGSTGSNHGSGSMGTSSSGIDEIVDAITGESSGRNSSEAPYSPRLTSSFQNRNRSGSRKSISFGSTEGSKGSGSSHSLGSNMGGELARRRISSASNQSLSSRGLHETQMRMSQATPSSPRQMTTDRTIKPPKLPAQEGSSNMEAAKSEPLKPSHPPSQTSPPKPPKEKKKSSPKTERPSINTLTDPGESGSTTLTPARVNHLLPNDRTRPVSPGPVQHVSDYQKPSRNQAPPKLPMKVMVVEDDPINRLILKKKLTLSGHSVSLTVHGQEAIELFERDPSKFDIILMDLQMPICDGMQATRKIREFERSMNGGSPSTEQSETRRSEEGSAEGQSPMGLLPQSHRVNFGVPIIAVSASLHEAQRKDILEAGMDGWILKPVDFTRLATLMLASVDVSIRAGLVYKPGTWDQGGWLCLPKKSARNHERK